MAKDKNIAELAGTAVNIAPFGEVRYWTGNAADNIEHHHIESQNGVYAPVYVAEQGGSHLGIEWSVPKQIECIVVRYNGKAPKPSDVKLQYWNHTWPDKWRSGWTKIEDPFNGSWVTANTSVKISGRTATYTFHPLDFPEIDRATDHAYTYRQTYRFRLLYCDRNDFKIEGISVFSTAKWKLASIRIEYTGAQKYSGRMSIKNGYLVSESIKDNTVIIDALIADCSRQIDPQLMPVAPDMTVITVKAKPCDFSFAVSDVLQAPMSLPDFEVMISSASVKKPTLPRKAPKPIFDRILDEPEQSYERASTEIPQLVKTCQQRYVPIGCDANRQEFALRFNGHLFANKQKMKALSEDVQRLLWPGIQIEYKFPTMDPPDFRDREDACEQSALNNYLPIYTTAWRDREIAFEKIDFAALLMESPENEAKKRGDETSVGLSRITIRNASEDTRRARFWVVIEPAEALEVRDGYVFSIGRIQKHEVPWHLQGAKESDWYNASYESPRLRAYIDTKGKGNLKAASCAYEPEMISGLDNAVAYDITLEPRQSHVIDLKIPFVTILTDEETTALKSVSFDDKLKEMSAYWESRIDAGASIKTPEPIINEFVKATIPHIGITADKDIKTGFYLLPAGTYDYNVCANEAMHQVRSLDFRGLHDEARKYLMPFVWCQGSRPLHGKFKTQKGVLHGLKVDNETDYQTFNYNLDHGFVLFALCEHYFLTRDKRWISSIAQNLIDACDFVSLERESTKKIMQTGEKCPEFGLLPPGHLEDNPEWLYWYAVNAYCYRGMAAAAKALEDIKHPDTSRIARDAANYRDDLRRSMKYHMENSPVGRLSDGTAVPFTPTRAGLLSRDLGWIRDSLYGPIHAIECGVLDPCEDQSTWILKDSEDNVFVNKYRGRQVDLEKYWFSHGGNTIQSGLLPMVMVYVKRDQPEHAIRSLFNAFAQNIYRDVRCFTEHPVMAFGLGAGPFYKTPDECCWVNWLRHVLLTERGYDELIITPATPREWFAEGKNISVENVATYFGPVSFEIESSKHEISAVITPPKRNPPKAFEIRFRHPDKKPIKSVTLNGVDWKHFDKKTEIIRLEIGQAKKLTVSAKY